MNQLELQKQQTQKTRSLKIDAYVSVNVLDLAAVIRV